MLCQQSGEDLCILLLVVALPERPRETLSKTVAFGGSGLTYGEAGNSVYGTQKSAQLKAIHTLTQ